MAFDRSGKRGRGPGATAPADPRLSLASSIAQALGVDLELGRDPDLPRARQALLAAVSALRPTASAPSLGELLAALPSMPPGGRAVRRALAEIEAIVSRVAYARTKRAERGRLLAELLVLYGLEGLVGVAASAELEAAVREVRRAADELVWGK